MSGLIPLEDFEYAVAQLSLLPVQHVEPKVVKVPIRRPLQEVGQKRIHLTDAAITEDRQARRGSGSCLPLEIIHMIASELFSSSHLSSPSWLVALQSPSHEEGTNQSNMHHNFKALLQLSSTCKSFRSILAPLIWHTVHFHHPRHFGEFVQLMKRYKSISSPLSAIVGASPESQSYAWKHEYPLRLVKEIYLVMPQRYPGFDQGLLVALLRDGMQSSLKHVIWEAEELPAASTLKALVAHDYYSTIKQVEISDRQPAFGLASEIDENDIVEWTRSSRDGEAFPTKGHLIPLDEMPLNSSEANSEAETNGLVSLSINCKCFWPGHAALSNFSTLRHLHLTYYDLFLIPPHLPALLQHLHQPLLSLSMSTSKTSLFHSIPLINLGCFDHLQLLDLYPVTPEFPLPQAIRRCRKTLRILRLVMDISANFVNFDNLWKILAGDDYASSEGSEMVGSMEALEVLHVDPMPQQNTAPSFVSFVEACPKLEWVNGRRRDSFAPGMEPINPDDITSAMYF